MTWTGDMPGKADYTAHETGKTCSFKFTHYRDTLIRAGEQGYKLIPFCEYERIGPDEKLIILRHDIDFSVERALMFAEIEAEVGAAATYFVRLHANDYNPFGFRVYHTLRRILSLGHEIGLHFESGDMKQVSSEDEKTLFIKEKKVLETILDIRVVSASQHGDYSFYSNPEARFFFEGHSLDEVGIKNYPFEDRFFKEMKYLSDSNSLWKEGCFCGHLGKHPRMQVLTHPRWWFREHYHLW